MPDTVHAPGPSRVARVWRATALALLTVAVGSYLFILHPWLMSWGATPSEVAARLPGDELAPAPYFTRAITIDAPPSVVWKWLLQIGQDRAGFYSNTWLENLVTADIHNAHIIHPEWQARALGDSVPLARPALANPGGHDRIGYVQIVAMQRERMIANIPGRFVLEPVGERATRLLFRESLSSQGPVLTRWLAWDATHFVMVQRMLRGIKERAEQKPLVPNALTVLARAGWLGVAACLLGAFLAHSRTRRWVVLPIAFGLPPLLLTGDWNAALAGFLALGVIVLSTLRLGRRGWPVLLSAACCVFMVLLLAPDPYVVFGLVFVTSSFLALLATLSGPGQRVLRGGPRPGDHALQG